MRMWRLIGGSILAGAVVLLGACGAPGSDRAPLVVGELFPMTGSEPFVGQWLAHGAQAAVADINASGGCDGRPLQPSLADTAGDAVIAAESLQRLERLRPAFVVGPTSLDFEVVLDEFDLAHLPDFVEGGTTTLDQLQDPYVFRTTASDTTLAIGMAYYALQHGETRAALVFASTPNAQDIVPPLVASYVAHGGTITEDEILTPEQASYRAQVAQVFASHPQVVFMQTDATTARTFFDAVQQQHDLNIPFIGTDSAADPAYAQAMGMGNAARWLTGMIAAAPSTPAWARYTQVYQRVWQTAQPLPMSQNAYDAIVIACLAMTMARSTSPTVWVHDVTTVANGPGTAVYTYAQGVAALKAGKRINYQGASGSDDFDPYHNVQAAWEVVQWDASGTALQPLARISTAQIASWAKIT